MGLDSAQVKLEVFLDWMCPYSASFWPPVKQLVAHYGESKLQLIVHLFPLPVCK